MPAPAAGRALAAPCLLYTSTLFGFSAPAERDLFDTVQTVSGVGPRLALAMLSVHDPDALRLALSGGDIAALTKVPGIGKKGAERLVLELSLIHI